METLGRTVGFTVLGSLSLAILAGVVLLPPYARLVEARYRRDCLQARIADRETLIAVNDRLIRALPQDDVMTRRLARSQSEWIPADEAVAIDLDPAKRGFAPSQIVTVTPHRRPAEPDGWIVRTAAKLQVPARRVALLLLAGVYMLVALFLYAPREKHRRAHPEPARRSPTASRTAAS